VKTNVNIKQKTNRFLIMEKTRRTSRTKKRVAPPPPPPVEEEEYEEEDEYEEVEADENLVEQLHQLYAEREKLESRLGVSSAEEVIAMVDNLEAQLNEYYKMREEMHSRAKDLRLRLEFVESFL
jgi:hypothetical protein